MEDWSKLRERMVEKQLRRRGIRDARVLAAMEYRGIAADVDYLRELQGEFADAVAAAAAECYAVIGREVNLGSPKQLQAVIFDELTMVNRAATPPNVTLVTPVK